MTAVAAVTTAPAAAETDKQLTTTNGKVHPEPDAQNTYLPSPTLTNQLSTTVTPTPQQPASVTVRQRNPSACDSQDRVSLSDDDELKHILNIPPQNLSSATFSNEVSPNDPRTKAYAAGGSDTKERETTTTLNPLKKVLNMAHPSSSHSHDSDNDKDSQQKTEHKHVISVQGAHDIHAEINNPAAVSVEAANNPNETLVVIPTHYVFIFSNPRSGNQQGLPLVSMNIQHYRMRDQPHVQVQLYDFLDLDDRNAGLKYLYLLVKKQKSLKEVHVWSAGGDGTLMGVVECMMEMEIDIHDPRVLFSVIPFGTGNDLSQVLGWGRYVSGTDVAGKHLEGLNDLVMARLKGHTTLLDIWEVEITTEEGGWVQQAGKEKKTSLRRKMSNYSSIGLQGRVGVGFEKNRRGSRVMNAWEYTKQSAGVLAHGASRVTDHLKAMSEGEKTFNIESKDALRVTRHPVEMIIQNIPGMWGRHIDLWGVAEMSRSIIKDQSGPTDMEQWTPHTAYDGKLEVFGIGSLRSYLKKQFPWGRKNLQRIGQFASPYTIDFKPSNHLHAMIDGEFYELNNTKTITYNRIFQIRMVGSAPPTSRLVRDMVEHRADLPGPTGEGEEPGVDFEVGKTEYANESRRDREERGVSSEEHSRPEQEPQQPVQINGTS